MKKTNNNQAEETKNLNKAWTAINHFFFEVFDIKTGTDKKGTIEDIKEKIAMKGNTAWILVFSILIASIGLNIGSPAVVIGAMLISPLMGPILGVGLSIGTNDIDTLKRSLINFGVMIALSLGTSFLFFLIPIFRNETPELIARTTPDVRDVFIAMAGGFALIIALSRRSEQTNTIAGVAIATALMPPLCTAGYGLAIGNFSYFGGAMFLVAINSIFIALATFAIVKFLRFPMVKYLDSANRKRIARMASIVAFLVFAGSLYMFFNLFKINQFKQSAENLIADIKKSGINIIDEKAEDLDYESNSVKIYVYGKMLSSDEINYWIAKLPKYGFTNTKLIVEQGVDSDLMINVENLTELYRQNQKVISSRDESLREKEDKIKLLENELSKFYKSQIPFIQISKEAQINYSDLKQLSYSNQVNTNFSDIDTITVFNAEWDKSVPKKDLKKDQLKKWLKTRLNLDTLIVNQN